MMLNPDILWQWALTLAYRVLLCFWFVFRPRTRGVHVAVWHDGRVLLIRNSYKPGYTLPGGCLKSGEKAVRAAARELCEEVALRVSPNALHFVGAFPNPHEFKRDTIYLFEITLPDRPAFRADQREVAEAAFISPSQALRLSLFPTVRRYLQHRLSGPDRLTTTG
ncbi:NUDIX hydrolase [Desulfonema ishimotonii]|uniref:NUDIX hydrolase n=1 Tax=Desulfonema ishimotonii TaxID=45657 RepID=A0A401FU05_9BACT|nr:NUDIX domain-containing protein [Desulfonema ishimotonii]GBC60440.1 NUDIX hydrolase [Desulfonema ishimotonii]